MGAATHDFERGATDFAPMMEDVARRFFGEPNRAFSKGDRLRFGNKGSIEIDRRDGWFANYEADVRGGVLDLIMHQQRCDKRGALDWLTSEGLLAAEPVIRPRSANTSGRASGSTFYDYADVEGVVAYRVERRGKDQLPRFLQHGPDGRGGYHAGKGCMQGVARLPYRLPELLAAPADAIVFVVEGEKDADRLASLGLVATTNSEGAGKFRAELAPHFAGRRVVIIPDNDQAGQDHAADVAEKLRGPATVVAVLQLPNLPPKGDVSDALERGLEPEGLIRMADAALATVAEADLLPLLDPSAWAHADTPPREWRLEEWIPDRQATYLTGPGSAGKSLVSQLLCTCMALGLPFMGIDTRACTTVYITCEDDPDELHRRQKAICAGLNVSLTALRGKLHLVSLVGAVGNELATFTAEGTLERTPAWRKLRATVLAIGAGFIVLDNVAHLFAGNENIRNQVAAFVALLNNLAQEARAAVLFLGHPNKAGDAFSGSTAWENQVRSRLFMETPKDEQGDVPDPDARVLSRGKANYARNGERLAFRWHQGTFVRGEDMAPNMAAEISANAQANYDNDLFLRCLDERNRQARAVSESKASRTYAPKEFAVMAESKGVGRARMEAALDRLFRIGAIERGVIGRHAGEGKDMIGLRRRSDDLSDDVPMTPSDDVPATYRRPPTAHTPYTTYMDGAATQAAAPSPKQDQSRRHGEPILAEGESIDDPIPGWPDDQ